MNWTLIITAVAAAFLTGVEAWQRFAAQQSGVALGTAQAAAQASGQAAVAQTAIAQAEAAAPRTQPALIDRLRAGSF